MKTRKSWIWWNLVLLFHLGSLKRILQHMELCMKNLDSKLHCRFHTGAAIFLLFPYFFASEAWSLHLSIFLMWILISDCFVCICRSFGEDFNLPDPVVKVPALLIMGGKDYVFKFPGIEDLTKGEKAKELVPNLEVTFIPEGTHFVQEQFPEQVNQLILDFLAKHTWSLVVH